MAIANGKIRKSGYQRCFSGAPKQNRVFDHGRSTKGIRVDIRHINNRIWPLLVANEIAFALDGGDQIGIVVLHVQVFAACTEGEFMGIETHTILYFVGYFEFGRLLTLNDRPIITLGNVKSEIA